jgi:hypothetical protein
MMKKEGKYPGLQHPSLKQHPFSVPDGYFDSFPDRLKDRIHALQEEPVPLRSPGRSYRFRLAMAAAIVGLALVSYPLIRLVAPAADHSSEYLDLALLEGAGLFNNDYDLARYLEGEDATLDEEEAYLNQAMEYLATNDVEMDLIFESQK